MQCSRNQPEGGVLLWLKMSVSTSTETSMRYTTDYILSTCVIHDMSFIVFYRLIGITRRHQMSMQKEATLQWLSLVYNRQVALDFWPPFIGLCTEIPIRSWRLSSSHPMQCTAYVLNVCIIWLHQIILHNKSQSHLTHCRHLWKRNCMSKLLLCLHKFLGSKMKTEQNLCIYADSIFFDVHD